MTQPKQNLAQFKSFSIKCIANQGDARIRKFKKNISSNRNICTREDVVNSQK